MANELVVPKVPNVLVHPQEHFLELRVDLQPTLPPERHGRTKAAREVCGPCGVPRLVRGVRRRGGLDGNASLPVIMHSDWLLLLGLGSLPSSRPALRKNDRSENENKQIVNR